MIIKESKFLATEEKGEVSAILMRPENASWLLVLAHGAGAGMRHRNLETIANRLAEAGVATFRYQFPYMERGGGRDSRVVTLATVRAAVSAAQQAAGDLPMLAGGHSFGGRMTSTAASEAPLPNVRGIVFFSFPLHPPGKPGIERADHLNDVNLPMLFLSGDRDKLAELDLLQPVCKKLGANATLHILETADHGFKILKRTRTNPEDVYSEMARKINEWISKLPQP